MQMFHLRLLLTLFIICSTNGLDDKVVNVVNEIEQENHQSFDFIFLEGCRRHYSDNDDPCWKSEQQRLWLNKNQPRQLTNLTDTGYAFLSVKSELAETLVQFWTLQKNEAKEERWPRGISHVNHWDSPTQYLELTSSVERKIYQTLLPVVENWVGSRLIPTALYGIRVYQKGAMIAPHVERLPLVISCVMPLTFHETWPLELIIHDGTAIHLNVEQPGDIICYESHTVLHGRPIPLQGKYYASINVYFEPLGYSTQHFHPKDSNDNYQRNSLQTRFHELEKMSRPEIRTIDTLPYYVPINKQNAWRQNYIYEPFHIPDLATIAISSSHHNDKTSPQKPPTAWTAAAAGDLKTLQEIVAKDPSSVTTADGNGWYPIHEAARSGETEVIRYLVENGADVNARTNHGKGGTALFWVEQSHDSKHPAITYLQSKGAKSIAPYAKVDNDQDVVVDDDDDGDDEKEDEAKDDDEEEEEDDVEDKDKDEDKVNDDEKEEEVKTKPETK